MNLESLNENQLKAVNHLNGSCMVLAGPGSGKTRVITYRINNMVINKNINPKNVLAISFTKASSTEMKNRAVKLFDDKRIENVNFGTFHSIFFKILRNFKGYTLDSILDEKTKRTGIKNILKNLNIENSEDDETLGQVINEISFIKNELMNIEDFSSEILSKEEIKNIYKMYEEYKTNINKIDFDDMLINTYFLLKENKNILEKVRNNYKYILIDEFQDINKVQFEAIKLISSPNNNIFVVGDEDQSIYGFRGSRPDFLLNFENYFKNTTKIFLDINYRSKKEIVDISNKLIKQNKNRYEKTIKCSKESGADFNCIECEDSEDEAKKIANDILDKINKYDYNYSDFSIIYRTNMQSRALVDVFLDKRIPFVMKDSIITIYDHWASQDILAYLKLSLNPKLNKEFLRIINKPFRYISRETLNSVKESRNIFNSLINEYDLHKKQIETLKDLMTDLEYIKNLSPKDAISYIRTTLDYDKYILDYCSNRKIKTNSLIDTLNEVESSSSNFKSIEAYLEHIENVKKELENTKKNNFIDGVVFTTMHSSKGLEFKNVYVVGCNEGTIPHEKSYEIEDEKIKIEQIEEERRLMYVALTRAEENLYLSTLKNKYGKRVFASRFVNEIKEITSKEINEINVGDKIYHKTFKDGEVIEHSEGTLKIKFRDKIRELNSRICLLKEIIKKI